MARKVSVVADLDTARYIAAAKGMEHATAAADEGQLEFAQFPLNLRYLDHGNLKRHKFLLVHIHDCFPLIVYLVSRG